MSPLGLGFGMLAAIGWGTSDFLAGFAVRGARALSVLLVAQIEVLLIAVPVFVLTGETIPSSAATAWALGAGIAGFAVLQFLYAGFAVGAMGPVVAISSVVGVVLPVAVGSITGDHLAWSGALGIACGVAAILFVTRTGSHLSLGRAAIALGILSGVAVGAYFVLIRESSIAGAGVWWTVIASRSVVVATALAVSGWRQDLKKSLAGATFPMLGIAIADLLATSSFFFATRQGGLGVAVVLASQSPALTTVFARFVLGQRLAKAQGFGIAMALVGLALIALP